MCVRVRTGIKSTFKLHTYGAIHTCAREVVYRTIAIHAYTLNTIQYSYGMMQNIDNIIYANIKIIYVY